MSNLVSIEWLKENLDNPDVIILDATMKEAASGEIILQKPIFIPRAQPFNFDTEICDRGSTLPHMLCSVEQFEQVTQKLGINQDSKIVIYDAMGIFSSPRAWWMFKIMGHENVYVLDGGLPKWIEANHPTQTSLSKPKQKGKFKVKFNPEGVSSAQQVINALDDDTVQIIDARSKERFYAEEPEARVGLRGGHIPNSYCLPYFELIENGLFKNETQLKEIFEEFIDDSKRKIFSCGSGVTACILALGASECGLDNWAIYDGSWSEWGANQQLPIEIS